MLRALRASFSLIMPELPEVEAARSLAEKHCTGHTIVSASVADDDKVIDGIAPRDLEAALKGRTIQEACRKGKQMWLDLGKDSPALMLHFGMTGMLVVQGVDAAKYVNAKQVDKAVWPPKYCKIELELSDGAKVAFCDSRRFARARFQEDPLKNPPVSLLGYDILTDRPSAEQLKQALGKRKSAIKSVIMDQAVLAGVGNWVADEVLHTARIHPNERACDLSPEQTEALRAALLEVAQASVEVNADAERFPDDWLFAHRWKPKTAPARLKFLTIGGRTTCYEPAVQKLLSPPAEEAASDDDGGTKPKAAGKKAKAKPAAKSAPADEDGAAEPEAAAAKPTAGRGAARQKQPPADSSGAAAGAAKGRKKRGKPAADGELSADAEPAEAAAAGAKPAKKRSRGKKQ